nr:MAG TPA: hypothetical protein [Caudoviricetes sp.]
MLIAVRGRYVYVSLSCVQISLVERANFFAIVYSPVKRFKGINPVLFCKGDYHV